MRDDGDACDPRADVEALNAVMRPEDALECDARLSSGWGAAYFQTQEPGKRFIAPRGLAGIGWGGGAAIGAQAALPAGARAWCLVGDGAWGYALQEVETAVRRELPIVYVVLNNSSLAWIHHGRVKSGKTLSSAFGACDYAMAARAFGAHGVRVGTDDDLVAALREAASTGRCSVLDVRSSQTLSPVLDAPDWARTEQEGAPIRDAYRE
jgi:acetolactate synthase-1/2/3 large subunit